MGKGTEPKDNVDDRVESPGGVVVRRALFARSSDPDDELVLGGDGEEGEVDGEDVEFALRSVALGCHVLQWVHLIGGSIQRDEQELVSLQLVAFLDLRHGMSLLLIVQIAIPLRSHI